MLQVESIKNQQMSICLTLNASFSAYSDAGISATGMLARMALAELAATCIPIAILRLGYKSARPGLSALECQTVRGIRSRVSGWRLHPRGAWLQSQCFFEQALAAGCLRKLDTRCLRPSQTVGPAGPEPCNSAAVHQDQADSHLELSP